MRGWARPAPAALLCTVDTKNGSLEDAKGFLSEWEGKGRAFPLSASSIGQRCLTAGASLQPC